MNLNQELIDRINRVRKDSKADILGVWESVLNEILSKYTTIDSCQISLTYNNFIVEKINEITNIWIEVSPAVFSSVRYTGMQALAFSALLEKNIKSEELVQLHQELTDLYYEVRLPFFMYFHYKNKVGIIND